MATAVEENGCVWVCNGRTETGYTIPLILKTFAFLFPAWLGLLQKEASSILTGRRESTTRIPVAVPPVGSFPLLGLSRKGGNELCSARATVTTDKHFPTPRSQHNERGAKKGNHNSQQSLGKHNDHWSNSKSKSRIAEGAE